MYLQDDTGKQPGESVGFLQVFLWHDYKLFISQTLSSTAKMEMLALHVPLSGSIFIRSCGEKIFGLSLDSGDYRRKQFREGSATSGH